MKTQMFTLTMFTFRKSNIYLIVQLRMPAICGHIFTYEERILPTYYQRLFVV